MSMCDIRNFYVDNDPDHDIIVMRCEQVCSLVRIGRLLVDNLSTGFERDLRPLDLGCAYPLVENGKHRSCEAPRRPASSYCPQHHALCHVPSGTVEETRRLSEVEALASAVGGRRAHRARQPSAHFLKRLECVARDSRASKPPPSAPPQSPGRPRVLPDGAIPPDYASDGRSVGQPGGRGWGGEG
jgi:hypothetical protein